MNYALTVTTSKLVVATGTGWVRIWAGQTLDERRLAEEVRAQLGLDPSCELTLEVLEREEVGDRVALKVLFVAKENVTAVVAVEGEPPVA